MRHFQATVDMPFTLHSPTPDAVKALKERFLSMALNENPAGTQGEIEVITTTLVTGQRFAMHLRIGLVDAPESGSARNDQARNVGTQETGSGPEDSAGHGRRSGQGSEAGEIRGPRAHGKSSGSH